MKVRNISYKISRIVLHVVLIALAVLMLIPLVWILSVSLKLDKDVFSSPIKRILRNPRWTNYTDIWTKIPLTKLVLNTTKLAIIVTILQLFIGSFAACAFVKLKLRHRDSLFLAYMSTIAMPWQVYMVLQFIMMRFVGMNDSHMAIICLRAFSTFGVFMVRQFYREISGGLCGAARIDGINEYQIWYKIMLSLLRSALPALTIFTFAGTWNDLLRPIIYLKIGARRILQIELRTFISQYSSEYELAMAASVLSLIPVLVVFLFLQRYSVERIVATGVKEQDRARKKHGSESVAGVPSVFPISGYRAVSDKEEMEQPGGPNSNMAKRRIREDE